MTKEEINRINSLLKNIDNVATLLNELLLPIDELEKKNNCSQKEACNIKIKAEEYLKKYGVFTLTATSTAIKQMTKNILQ